MARLDQSGDQAVADSVGGIELHGHLGDRLLHARIVGAPASGHIGRGDGAAADRPDLMNTAGIIDQHGARQTHGFASLGVLTMGQAVEIGELHLESVELRRGPPPI